MTQGTKRDKYVFLPSNTGAVAAMTSNKLSAGCGSFALLSNPFFALRVFLVA
jgi:hypothetical protein